jgi:hypothetical protein
MARLTDKLYWIFSLKICLTFLILRIFQGGITTNAQGPLSEVPLLLTDFNQT